MSRSRIGAVMREERQRLRWTQQDLAKEVNVHRSMISDWELGAALIPQHGLSLGGTTWRAAFSQFRKRPKCWE